VKNSSTGFTTGCLNSLGPAIPELAEDPELAEEEPVSLGTFVTTVTGSGDAPPPPRRVNTAINTPKNAIEPKASAGKNQTGFFFLRLTGITCGFIAGDFFEGLVIAFFGADGFSLRTSTMSEVLTTCCTELFAAGAGVASAGVTGAGVTGAGVTGAGVTGAGVAGSGVVFFGSKDECSAWVVAF
jgi:hypothetical protein